MSLASRFRNGQALTLKKTWLSIAGATLIPLTAFGSTGVQSTIVQNGAPIAIDRCVVVLKNASGAEANESLSEDVGFTNVSQRTATQVRFGFEIVDASGLTELTVMGDKLGSFAPGMAINDSNETPASEYIRQTVSALPHVAKALCKVQMVRFDDGSIWHEGDGPAGSSVMYTPLPGPSPTVQWQWPYDPPTP
jgi:hypothetical protein